MKLRALLPLPLALVPALASAQAPAGPEFRVNVFTTDRQSDPRVAMDRAGNFTVVWTSWNQDGSGAGVFGRRFEVGGGPLGGEFPVNTTTTGSQGALGELAVAGSPAGRSAAVWVGDAPLFSRRVFAQRYDRSGARVGTEFEVSQQSYRDPQVGIGAGGQMVVLWQGSMQITGQRFDPSGARVGSEFVVSAHTEPFFPPAHPQVQIAPDGSFMVVWQDLDAPLPPPPFPPSANYGVFARPYDANGVPLTPPFRVNADTIGWQLSPGLVRQPIGQFVVVWRDYERGVFGRFLGGSGSPLGQEFQVNTSPAGYADIPAVAVDGADNFVVAWMAGEEIVARRFDGAGAPRTGEFAVNVPSPAQPEGNPSLASDEAGNFVVTWQNTRNVTQDIDVIARRFGGLVPSALAVTGGSGVLELGSFGLATSWRNVSDAALTPQGTAVVCNAPPGLACGLTSSQASYGTIASGATATCSGACFAGFVSGTRTPGHVDLALREDILPAIQGQAKVWTLHLGGSFSDVPAASPFYRFVEALLHRGVATGCGSGVYCPASSTTREQMAVFVLVAREDTDWAPPACGVPSFADVPAGSPFCSWVEELAGRGVVSGCGGGNYCPGDAVTRGQMPVFVLRALDPALNPPACGVPMFADVPASSPFCRWIEELARRGVVTGCGGGNYCPGAPVTREQMGAFITVTFGLGLYGP